MFKIPESVKNKYEFVTLAAKRAEQLQMGALPRVDNINGRSTVVAQEEVAVGKIRAFDPDQDPLDVEFEEEE